MDVLRRLTYLIQEVFDFEKRNQYVFFLLTNDYLNKFKHV